MDTMQYLKKLLGDDAADIFGEALSQDFTPLSHSEVAALERKGAATFPDEMREFLLTLGTAGIMDADRFERFDPEENPDYELLEMWNDASADDSEIEGYLADEAEGSVSSAATKERIASYRAEVEAAEEISERAITLQVVEFDGYIILDPTTGKVYSFSLENDESPNGLKLLGTFQAWAADRLSDLWG